MIEIDDNLLTYLEDLSSLTLTDEEKAGMKGDLQKILDYMTGLNELNTEGVPERSHPFDNVNAFREDEVTQSYPRELILQNAPVRNEETTIAPIVNV